MEIKIREAREEDIEKILKLKSLLFELHIKMDDFYRPNKNFKQMYRDHIKTILASDTHKLFVAEDEKNIVGFIEGGMSQISEFFDENIMGSIYEIFVKEDYRKLGISKQLFVPLSSWFRKRKLKNIEVTVDFRNKKAINAWKKLGFAEYQKKMKINL